jgi:aminopeptidase-like protein
VSTSQGQQLRDFAARLYPICRSITGEGLRATLRLIGERLPLAIQEIPSGSRIFDWTVPLEWNIEDAYLCDPSGRRVVNFEAHNLHIVSYSEPVSGAYTLEELAPRLHSLPEHPEWIPYRTSYYKRSWGFCLRHRDRESLRPGKYRVEIATSLAAGALTFGEAVLPGRSREEVIFFTHACHPSLANDNTSGMAVATALAQWLAGESRRYTYRFVFAPGTIGSLCWLRRNESRLGRIRHGLVLALLGDPGPLTYKMSRTESSEIDAAAAYVLTGMDPEARVIPFTPYGYDERQLCSPGFNLPVGRLTRSVNAGFAQYHTSADDLTLIRPECLEQSLEACRRIVQVLEDNRRYVNLSPKGEPLLGKRGLYGSVGGRSPAEHEQAILWVLNQSDGRASLLDIARRSGMPFGALRDAANALEDARLLKHAADAGSRSRKREPAGAGRRAAAAKRPRPRKSARRRTRT